MTLISLDYDKKPFKFVLFHPVFTPPNLTSSVPPELSFWADHIMEQLKNIQFLLITYKVKNRHIHVTYKMLQDLIPIYLSSCIFHHFPSTYFTVHPRPDSSLLTKPTKSSSASTSEHILKKFLLIFQDPTQRP